MSRSLCHSVNVADKFYVGEDTVQEAHETRRLLEQALQSSADTQAPVSNVRRRRIVEVESSDDDVQELAIPMTSSEKDTGKEATEPIAKEPEGPGCSEECPSSIPEAREELSDEEDASAVQISDDDEDLTQQEKREMVFSSSIVFIDIAPLMIYNLKVLHRAQIHSISQFYRTVSMFFAI